MTTETLAYMVTADTRQLDTMKRKISEVNRTAATQTGKARANAAQQGAAYSALAGKARIMSIGIAGIGVASFKAAADFERSMNVFGASAEASESDMKKAREEAIRLGNDLQLPGVSAKDAADSMNELAKGGFNATQSIDAARGVLLLGQAANMEYADAATATARTLKAFEMPAKQATVAVDAMAGASLKSTASLEEIAKGMEFTALSAHTLGVDVIDTSTALAMLNDAGVSGAKAGTALNEMFKRMTKPTKAAAGAMRHLGLMTKSGNSAFFDSKGRFIGMEEASGKLSKALADLNPKQRQAALQTMFAGTAMRAADVVLGKGTKKWNTYREAVGKQGTAAKVAAAANKGSAGSIDALISSAQTAAIMLGTALAPAFQSVLDVVTPFIQFLGEHAGLVAGVGGAILAFAATFWVLSGAMAFAETVAIAFGVSAEAAWLAALGPIALIIAAVAAVAVGLVILYKKSETFRRIVDAAWSGVKQVVTAVTDALTAAFEKVSEVLLGTFGPAFDEARRTAEAWAGGLATAWEKVRGPMGSVLGFIGDQLAKLKPLFDIAVIVVKTFVKVWLAVVGAWFTFVVNVFKIIMRLLRGDWSAAWDMAKQTVTDVVNSMKEVLQILWDAAKQVFSKILDFLRATWPFIISILLGPLGVAIALIIKNWDKISATAKRAFGAVKGAAVAMKNAVVGAWNGLKSGVSSAVGAVSRAVDKAVGFFRELPGRVVSAITSLPGKVKDKFLAVLQKIGEVELMAFNAALDLGRSIVSGIISGLANLLSAAYDKIAGGVRGAIDKAKNFLGSTAEQYASRMLGDPIVAGIAGGIAAGQSAVSGSLNTMLTNAIKKGRFDRISELIQRQFQQMQAAEMTESEKTIAGIERARQVADLQQAYIDAVKSGEAGAIARAAQDIELFNLRQKAEQERAALEEKQYAASLQLSDRLEALRKAFEKVPKGASKRARRAAATRRRRAKGALEALRQEIGAPAQYIGAPVTLPTTGTGAPATPGGPTVDIGTIVIREELDVAKMTAALSAAVAVRT